MELTITIKCIDVIEAQQVLAQLRGPAPALEPINDPSHGMNYPDGVVAGQVQQTSTSLLADVGFGKGVTLPAGAIPAPASAVAAPSATVPAAPSGTPATPPVPMAPAQPPAPEAPAPTAPAAPTTGAPGVELDVTGLPWDRRIHAGTKSKKQDGSWTALRGVDPSVKVAVEQELRNLMAMNAAAGAQAPAAAPVAPPAPAPIAPPAPVAPPPAPEAPAAPAGERDPASAPAGEAFAVLMERLTPLMEAGKITPDRISAHLQPMKLSGFGQLAIAPNLIPQFWASIKPEVLAASMGL